MWSRELFDLMIYLEKNIPDIPDGPLYEFGCYPGVATKQIRKVVPLKREVIGFDMLECNIENTVVCDVFNLPDQYDKPIAICINDLYSEQWELLFEQIYPKILPGGFYIQSLKGPDCHVNDYLAKLERINVGPRFIFAGRKKDV